MKLLKREISSKNGDGFVTVIAEEPEDMWHIYNLIAPGDHLRASTYRKVVREGTTGSTVSSRVRTTLTLEIEAIHFDPSTCAARVKGKNVEENQYVRMGAYHTIDLELNQKFTLRKPCWDAMYLERLQMATDVGARADLAALVMQEGLAHLCLITAHMTVLRAKIEQPIPRKRRGSSSQHDKSLLRFYDSVMQSILRHVDFGIIKAVVVASPGFVKDDFFRYMFDQAVKQDIKLLHENRAKFILVHSTSGHKRAVNEVLADPAIASRLADTKARGEVAALERFHKALNDDPDRAYYGLKHVERADAEDAVEELLVADSLFRSHDFRVRRRYVDLVESVRESGGTVHIFSSMHVSGEQLAQLTGIAAILRFPLPDIESDHDDDAGADDGSESANSSDEEDRDAAFALGIDDDLARPAPAEASGKGAAGGGAGAGAEAEVGAEAEEVEEAKGSPMRPEAAAAKATAAAAPASSAPAAAPAAATAAEGGKKKKKKKGKKKVPQRAPLEDEDEEYFEDYDDYGYDDFM